MLDGPERRFPNQRGAKILVFSYDPGMVPSPELSALMKAVEEHLELLQKSKAELLEAIQETEAVSNDLRRCIEEARQLLDGLPSEPQSADNTYPRH